MDRVVANRISSLITQYAWLVSPSAPQHAKFAYLAEAIEWVLGLLEGEYPAEYIEGQRLADFRADKRARFDGGDRV